LEEKEEDPCPKLGVSQLPSRHSSSIADWLAGCDGGAYARIRTES